MWGAVVQAQLHAHHTQGTGIKIVLHPRSLHGHVHSSPRSLRSSLCHLASQRKLHVCKPIQRRPSRRPARSAAHSGGKPCALQHVQAALRALPIKLLEGNLSLPQSHLREGCMQRATAGAAAAA